MNGEVISRSLLPCPVPSGWQTSATHRPSASAVFRPEIRDEADALEVAPVLSSRSGDNHVLELALAGGAGIIVSHNVRDFAGSELRFPDVRILRPAEFLKEMK